MESSERLSLIEARKLAKSYGRVVALAGTDFTLRRGECIGLLGDNGAGKSTLVKILSGAVKPDSGELLINNLPANFGSPLDARAAGIETVYQDLALATSRNAAANIFLGREIMRSDFLGKLGFIDHAVMRAKTEELLASLKIKIQSLDHPVGSFSGGQRQAVAIARAIAWGRHVLILDEPTAALGMRQRRLVIDLIQRLREEHPALGIILISHDLPEIKETTDRVVVLRHGRTVAELATDSVTEHELIAAMTGTAA